MKPAAVLLIDFENFYHSRRDYFSKANLAVGQQPELTDDLATLVRLAERMTDLPLGVRRAYANFNMIQGAPRDLMSRGIEPVQVFCLTEGQNKNAADMRMAMDAMALACSGAPFEHFVLVTGDSDFIPVILELKSRGHAVSVIAVTGSSGALIRRFADKFKRFEDVVVKPPTAPRPVRPSAVVTPVVAGVPGPTARITPAGVPGATAVPDVPVVPAGPDELPRIAAALKQVLSRVRPVRMNAIHRELSKELGYSFDPAVFGGNSTGAFVRKHAAALGVVVRGTHNEQEVDLPGGPAPSTNGSHAPKSPAPRAAVGPAEPHTAAHYRELLGKGRANENIVNAISWASLVAVCDATVTVLAPPAGGPAQSLELLSKLKAAGAPDETRLIVSALRCALPRPTDAGVYSLPADSTGSHIRARLLNYIGYVLRTRLSDNHVEGPVRPEALAEVFEPGPALEQARQEVEAALAEPAPEPEPAAPPTPTPAPVRLSARLEAFHTPAGYRDLLKASQEGSAEPEHQSINPPPWTSFDRVCADTFAALAPAPDGVAVAELNCDQFQDRLCEAGKDVPVPNYRSHVRRALTLLKLSNAVLEQDGRVVLHPQVADSNDIRWAVLGVMLTVLTLRLRDRNVPGPVRADVFLAAIAAGPLTDELLPQVAQAVEGIERNFAEGAAEPAGAEPDAPLTEGPVEVVVASADAAVPVVQPEFAEPQPAVAERVVVEVVVTEVTAPQVFAEVAAAPEPVPATVSSDWTDPYSFDGTLPEFAQPAPAVPAASDPVSDSPEPGAGDTSSSGVLDVAALTRAALAHPTEPVAAVSVEPFAFSSVTAPTPECVPEPEAPPETGAPQPVATDEMRLEACVTLDGVPSAPSEEPATDSPVGAGCEVIPAQTGEPAPRLEWPADPAPCEDVPVEAVATAPEPAEPAVNESPASIVPLPEPAPVSSGVVADADPQSAGRAEGTEPSLPAVSDSWCSDPPAAEPEPDPVGNAPSAPVPTPDAAPPEEDIPLADLVTDDDPHFWHNVPVVAPVGPPVPAETASGAATITPTPPESRPPESA